MSFHETRSPRWQQGGADLAEQREALLRLLQYSVDRGYRRLTIRRYWMLKARGFEVPATQQSYCETIIAQYSSKVLERIAAAVHDWHRMVEPDVDCSFNSNSVFH